MNQPFERVVEWTDKDLLKNSLLPPHCGDTMKLHWLTARLEQYQQKNILSVRFEDQK